MVGAAFTPVLEDVFECILDRIHAHRRENAAETLIHAADELGAETPEQFMKFIEAAISDSAHQELLARALTIAQDTAMRDKRTSASRYAP